MRHLNAKPIALLAALAILVAVAGCGGGSDESTTAGGEATAPVGQAGSTTKSSSVPTHKAAKKERQKQKQRQPAEVNQKQTEKKIRELANSGKPIPADSPVAKQIIQSLTGNGGSGKKGKHGNNSVAKAIEEVISPPQNGGGGSSSGDGQSSPSGGVEKILEQLQK
ncbi:MAG: hypothetical protein ACTHO8_08910 [Solirubrobacterales bacterium]